MISPHSVILLPVKPQCNFLYRLICQLSFIYNQCRWIFIDIYKQTVACRWQIIKIVFSEHEAWNSQMVHVIILSSTLSPYTYLSKYRQPIFICINKIQQDATVCRYLFTASLLYMFRASIAPVIRSKKYCNCSLWYRSYYVTVQRPEPEAAVTVFCTPDDGCDGRPKHVE